MPFLTSQCFVSKVDISVVSSHLVKLAEQQTETHSLVGTFLQHVQDAFENAFDDDGASGKASGAG